MSNSVFQSVIVQLKDITDRVFGVMDTEGTVVSCTDVTMLGEHWSEAAMKVAGASDNVVTYGQKTFNAILSSASYFEYAVFCTGDDEAAKTYCSMAYIAVNDSKVF